MAGTNEESSALCCLTANLSRPNARESLIKSAMNRVAVKNEMIARRTTQVVVTHGLVTGAASRLREVRHSHLSRTSAARYRVEVATLRSQGVQRREHSFLTQPYGTRLCRRSAVSDFSLREWPLTSKPSLHPIPQSRCRGHVGLNQRLPINILFIGDGFRRNFGSMLFY